MAKHVTVIGAGIVGVCCALHLQREGFEEELMQQGRSEEAQHIAAVETGEENL